jgi:hypothetical protein
MLEHYFMWRTLQIDKGGSLLSSNEGMMLISQRKYVINLIKGQVNWVAKP